MNLAGEQGATQEFTGFRDRTVLITGGLGFIGSNLARRLCRAGARTVVVDSLDPRFGGNWANVADFAGDVECHVMDVRDADRLVPLVRSTDFIFSLAGQSSHMDSMVDPLTDLDINARATLSLLEVVRAVNPETRIVFAGTRQIYGIPQYLPVDEKHPVQPVDINGIHKLAAEWYHSLYARVHGIPATVLRLTNTYGPGMRVKDARQTFLGIWLRQALEGDEIRVYGDGTQLRDFTYVDDCVDALCLAALKDEAIGCTFNLGGMEVVSLHDLAMMLVNIVSGSTVRIVDWPPGQKQIDIGDYYGDSTLIRDTLGWHPRVPLDLGLRRSLSYLDDRRSEYWDV